MLDPLTLSSEPVPPLQELLERDDIETVEVSVSFFEEMWDKAGFSS